MSDHDPLPQDAPRTRFRRLLAVLGAGAALASVGVVVGVALKAGPTDALPEAAAAPTTATSAAPTSSTAASTSSTSAGPYSADQRGYVDSEARCDEKQLVMAYGRTQRSLVAICVDSDGALEYRGVRLSDKAALQIPATRGSDGTIIATNDGVTYSISPSVFLVSDGDNVIYRDSWIEFEQPRFSGGTSATPSSSTATTSATPSTSGSPTTTVSTTTVTVTTSVPATTSKAGG